MAGTTLVWGSGFCPTGRARRGDQVRHGQQSPAMRLWTVRWARRRSRSWRPGAGGVAAGWCPARCWPQVRGGAAAGQSPPRTGSPQPPGAVERGALGGQPRRDLVDRQALPAQPTTGGALSLAGADPRGGPGRRGGGEQLQLAGTVLTHQIDHRPPAVADPRPGLLVVEALDEERPQRLVAVVVDPRRRGEQLPPSCCADGRHIAGLADIPVGPPGEAAVRHRLLKLPVTKPDIDGLLG